MNVNRRSFLKGLSVAASVAAGGCASFNTPVAHRRKSGEKLNMGFIGCGGKGVCQSGCAAAGRKISN